MVDAYWLCPIQGMADPPRLPGKVTTTQYFFIGLSYAKLNSEQKSSPWTRVKN